MCISRIIVGYSIIMNFYSRIGIVFLALFYYTKVNFLKQIFIKISITIFFRYIDPKALKHHSNLL